MAWTDEIGNLLEQYKGASAASPPEHVQRDFNQVGQTAPPSAIASGLKEAFQSNQTPPFAQMVAHLFGQSNGEQRAGILNHLLSAAGRGALSTGVLSSLSGLLGNRSSITPDQAQQIPPEAVQQLAEHAQKQDPSIVERASEFYSQHPTLVQGLGASALALVMSRISQHR
jgi:hypothetical protein